MGVGGSHGQSGYSGGGGDPWGGDPYGGTYGGAYGPYDSNFNDYSMDYGYGNWGSPNYSGYNDPYGNPFSGGNNIPGGSNFGGSGDNSPDGGNVPADTDGSLPEDDSEKPWDQDRFQEELFGFLGPQAQAWAEGNFPNPMGMNEWMQQGGNQGPGNMFDYMQGLGIQQPDATMLTPTQDWWNNLSPEVMAGIEAPWIDAENQLAERLGSGGGGSAMGGWSGNSAAGFGKFFSDKAGDMGLQAWNLTAPGAALQYQTGVMDWQNQNMFGAQDYTNAYGRNLMDYGNYQQNTMRPYNTALNLMQPASTNQVASDNGPGMMSQLLGIAGTGIGAYFGGPMGAYVGYNAGNMLGDWF